ncbi:hypothetical protein COU18_01665 [Candidatus Kaiserbacteria bacterium CG10_big_fil_rev_8_21_14_0_10_51_14]|uniref:Uncharacterized protein n=1 Tax=Candidatus Kaiserbacteria bacterium CG10_big_fil_rev_8_21_14_0_10_51_14 TaxID=1974610 RepID=A0A2H0UCE2_9BACT|nr:MAG: hypothetical protein COU18_01665 [Candidatus Kaiserbacteria bacterium CG10_big_fil_rev_8_21_14_0_10_51_14]
MTLEEQMRHTPAADAERNERISRASLSHDERVRGYVPKADEVLKGKDATIVRNILAEWFNKITRAREGFEQDERIENLSNALDRRGVSFNMGDREERKYFLLALLLRYKQLQN